MRQTSLLEYLNANSHSCPVCGKSLKNQKGLSIHISKVHAITETPDRLPGESVEVHSEGRYVTLTIKLRRTLWTELKRAAFHSNIPVGDLIFKGLTRIIEIENMPASYIL